MIAALSIGMPSYQELIVLAVVGLLIFGRRLPEVGRALGKTVAQLRRGVQDFKDQMRADEDLREAGSTVREIKQAVAAPRAMVDPKAAWKKFEESSLAEDEASPSEPEKPKSDEGDSTLQ